MVDGIKFEDALIIMRAQSLILVHSHTFTECREKRQTAECANCNVSTVDKEWLFISCSCGAVDVATKTSHRGHHGALLNEIRKNANELI